MGLCAVKRLRVSQPEHTSVSHGLVGYSKLDRGTPRGPRGACKRVAGARAYERIAWAHPMVDSDRLVFTMRTRGQQPCQAERTSVSHGLGSFET